MQKSGPETIRAFIGLGSNLGDGPAVLSRAWRAIGAEDCIATVVISRPFISSPVGMSSRHWFTNCAGELNTSLTAHALLQVLLGIETAFGRTRDGGVVGYQDRVLDLDILYYGSLSVNEPGLVLPHPHIADRLFVLSPLAEIAPDLRGEGSLTVKDMEHRLIDRIQSMQIPAQEIIRKEW